MKNKTHNRKERNRLKRYHAIERNRAEMRRAEEARKKWIEDKAVEHFTTLAAQNEEFARLAAEMGLTPQATSEDIEYDEHGFITKESWERINVPKIASGEHLNAIASIPIVDDVEHAYNESTGTIERITPDAQMQAKMRATQLRHIANELSVQQADLFIAIEGAIEDQALSIELTTKWRDGQMFTHAQTKQLIDELIAYINNQPDEPEAPEPSRIILP